MSSVNGKGSNGAVTGTFAVKAGLAQMLKGGVIMDVVTAEQARIAEEAGACAALGDDIVDTDPQYQHAIGRLRTAFTQQQRVVLLGQHAPAIGILLGCIIGRGNRHSDVEGAVGATG